MFTNEEKLTVNTSYNDLIQILKSVLGTIYHHVQTTHD